MGDFGAWMHRQASDVGLVDNAMAEGIIEGPVALPIEVVGHHNTLGHEGRIIAG